MRRRYVEGRIENRRAVGRDLSSAKRKHLFGGPFFDRNCRAVGYVEIKCRARRGHVERNLVMGGEHGE